jgi:hypothetical protein
MFFRSERWPDEVHVARAALPDHVGLEPRAHYFFDDRAPWAIVDDALQGYGGTTGTEAVV